MSPDPPITKPKREPDANQRVAAAQTHSLFTALVDEGFSETQALQLLGVMLASAVAEHTRRDP